MKILQSVVFIASFIIAAAIVNKVQQLWMRLMGAEMMYFSMKKKLIAIVVVGILVFGLIGSVLGFGS